MEEKQPARQAHGSERRGAQGERRGRPMGAPDGLTRMRAAAAVSHLVCETGSKFDRSSGLQEQTHVSPQGSGISSSA